MNSGKRTVQPRGDAAAEAISVVASADPADSEGVQVWPAAWSFGPPMTPEEVMKHIENTFVVAVQGYVDAAKTYLPPISNFSHTELDVLREAGLPEGYVSRIPSLAKLFDSITAALESPISTDIAAQIRALKKVHELHQYGRVTDGDLAKWSGYMKTAMTGEKVPDEARKHYASADEFLINEALVYEFRTASGVPERVAILFDPPQPSDVPTEVQPREEATASASIFYDPAGSFGPVIIPSVSPADSAINDVTNRRTLPGSKRCPKSPLSPRTNVDPTVGGDALHDDVQPAVSDGYIEMVPGASPYFPKLAPVDGHFGSQADSLPGNVPGDRVVLDRMPLRPGHHARRMEFFSEEQMRQLQKAENAMLAD
jgi:hypothetical protein